MKKLLWILFAMTVITGMVFGGGKGDSGAVTIAGIYKSGDQQWFIQEGKASQDVVEAAGGKWMYMDAKMEASTYLQLVDTCIAQKVKGVLVCIPDQNLSQVTVSKLKEAGIPVIAVDDALQDESGKLLAPWVGIDAYTIGAAAGDWGVNYIKQNNLATDPAFGILLITAERVSSCVPRTQAEYDKVKAAFPSFPENKILRADHDGAVETANTAANAVIVGNPQIRKWLVMTINDEGAQGASRALEEAGLAATSRVVGFGGYAAPAEFEKPNSPFKAAAYFSARDVGATAAKQLMDHIQKGTPIPERYGTGAKMVQAGDDLKSIMPEYY